jgi:alkaline phosphatase
MPVSGFVTTYSANALITDSAAAGTAYATGTKTNNGMISIAPNGKRLKTILEAAREINKATGLVTTTSITDATPAVFGSHVESRSQQEAIAGQLIASRVDVLLGGGKAYFVPNASGNSWRSDNRDILAEAKSKGYSIVNTVNELESTNNQKIIGLFSPGNLTTKDPEPPLSMLATKAIKVLSENKDGFFLMVEGGLIDIASHHNDFDDMIKQLLEFDKAVAQGLDFARKDGNTLVIVTADHETGGLTLLCDDNGKLKPSWSSGGHSGVVVPLYAFGPESGRFAGLLDNTQVSNNIAGIWGLRIGLQDKSSKTTSSSRILTATPS